MHLKGKRGVRVFALGMAALVVTAGSARGNESDESINVPKLNKAMGRLVQEVLKAHQATPNALFRDLDFQLDERETILDDDDRFAARVRLKAVASRSRWSPNAETVLGADLGFSADRKKQRATLAIAGSLETDTLGLVRFAANELVADWCRPRDPEKDSDRAYCEAMKRLAGARTLDEVITTVVGLGYVAMADAKAAVTTAEKALADASPEHKATYEAQLKMAKADLTTTENVAAELKRGHEAGTATGTLRVAFREYDAGAFGELKDVELYLDAKRFDATLKYTMRDIRDIDDYFDMKPFVVEALKKLEAGNAEEVEEMKRFLELYLDIAASLVEGR